MPSSPRPYLPEPSELERGVTGFHIMVRRYTPFSTASMLAFLPQWPHFDYVIYYDIITSPLFLHSVTSPWPLSTDESWHHNTISECKERSMRQKCQHGCHVKRVYIVRGPRPENLNKKGTLFAPIHTSSNLVSLNWKYSVFFCNWYSFCLFLGPEMFFSGIHGNKYVFVLNKLTKIIFVVCC